MRTTVNPGRWLELVGSFELQRSGRTGRTLTVGDRESQRVVTHGAQLEQFLQDPEDTITGPIRITIEPANVAELS